MAIKIGVTGSSGFIGKHLVNALKSRKNVSLSYFDLPKGNLFNLDSVESFVAGKDIIVHTAAVNRGSDWEIVAGGVVATHNLISAIKKSKKRTKLVFLSSIQAETDTVYGLSKTLTEIMLQDFSREFHAAVSILRLPNVFGEGCSPFYNSVVATFCHQVAHGKKLSVRQAARKVNFIYVRDVVSLILKEIFARRKQTFYFKRVTTKNTIAIRDLARLIKSFKALRNPAGLKSKFHKDLYRTYCHVSKIKGQ